MPFARSRVRLTACWPGGTARPATPLVHVNHLQAASQGVPAPLGGLHNRRAVVAGGGPAAQQAVKAALTKLGTPYVLGAKGPNNFDCSG